jgi:hypothetical protein
MKTKVSDFIGSAVIEISAESIYFIIIGRDDDIDMFINKISRHDKHYLSIPMNIPIANECDNLQNIYNKTITIDSSTEAAQFYAVSEGYFDGFYMIMTMKNNKIDFPKIIINDSFKGSARSAIISWIKKNYGSMPKNINIKPLTIVGLDENILVYVAALD